MSRPRISVVVPVHNMDNKDAFLSRLIESLDKQTFKDFEVVITEEGKMAENTNAGIKKAKGEIIKILFMDDYLYSPFALQHVHHNLHDGWMASGCVHDDGGNIYNPHTPSWNDDILSGNNTIGSPSVIAFVNDDPPLFDENLSWLLDCDLYHRLHGRFGRPTLVNHLDVGMGIGPHQTTNIMPDSEKIREAGYLQGKYGNN